MRVPRAGVYTLTAVATAPVETPHTEAAASYPHLSVSDGPFTEIARSQPHWYESRAARGDLSELDLGNGTNTFTFRVTEPTRHGRDVYNFGSTTRWVTVAARPVGGGWTAGAEREARTRAPAGGRVGVNFTLLASSSVIRRTDRRPAFRAMPGDRSGVPASRALIHLG